MKKNEVAGIIVYLLILVLVLFVSFYIIQPQIESIYSANVLQTNIYVFTIICILLGVLLNVVLYEAGHVIGAKLGGYGVLYVNALGLALYKTKEGKFKLGFKHFDGLTGETKVYPKEGKKLKPLLYIWMPILLFLVELVATVVLYSFAIVYDDNSILLVISTGLIIAASIGGIIVVYNIIPYRLDSLNDGYRLTLLTKKENVEAYNELLLLEKDSFFGNPLGERKVFDKLTDFTASVNMYVVYDHLAKKEYDAAAEILTPIVNAEETVGQEERMRAGAQLIFIKLSTLPVEEAKSYYEKNFPADYRHFLAEDISMESIRAYVLLSGLVDDSKSEVEIALTRVRNALKRTDEGRKELEKTMLKEAITLVNNAHPKWNIKSYY